MAAARIRPSGAWYLVAAVIALAGLVAGAGLLWAGLFGPNGELGVVRSYHRASLPGSVEMRLDPGGYTVFAEGPGAGDSTLPAPRVDISVTGPDGGAVPLAGYAGTFTYQAAGHEGRAVATFRATAPGTYRLDAAGAPCPACAVAVGHGAWAGSFVAIVAGVLVPLAAVAVAVAVAVVTGVRRSRSRARFGPAPVAPFPPVAR